MDIQEYLNRLHAESQFIFKRTIIEKENLGTMHHLSSCLFEFSALVSDPQEKKLLSTVSSQLESSTLNVTLGLYRQAFSSLRLAFEMGLAAMYFSVNKMELHEWLDGRADIKWARLIDEENGVLSKRFSNAFFPECLEYIVGYRNKAISTYRHLSEYVHGNNETWETSGIKLCFNKEMFDLYFSHYKSILEVMIFVAICRYSRLLDEKSLDSLQFIVEDFNHIQAIRKLFGRE